MTAIAGQKYEPKGSKKKDHLLGIEKKMREMWDAEKIYEVNAPADFDGEHKQKYLTTFPYPYMNGRLHFGHAFSATKCEFSARFMRMCGRNSLFPFAFHCTGMPIVAAANKLKREIEDPSLPREQWKILKSMNISEEEIPNFVDPGYWVRYFPPKAYQDLHDFGCSIDWRRSFVTTDKNPYYDSFIRWQFNTLRAKNKLSFGKRHTVFCTIDRQPCADHDRQSGEGIMPQQYTLIKLEVLDPLPAVLQPFKGEKIFLVAATLRPETMYGQTNCYILPEGDYGVVRMRTGELFVASERAVKNMAYQEMLPEQGKYSFLARVKGSELMGAALKAPLTKYERVYLLPMLNITMKKGTGIVTSVPSDAPDDWAVLRDLQKKKALREKLGIKDEWVMGFEPISILTTPTYGPLTAIKVCEEMKIVSQNDTEKLREAKDIAYLKGFNEGVMTVGICAGEKVSVAKTKVRKHMIDNGLAADYWEPMDTVISRSGDDCVVALCDQWSIGYGEPKWKELVMSHVTSPNFTCYSDTCHKCFIETLDWLRDWACSRTFGMGTHLPWDPQFLIESLSDSTIYMAFYTVAHLLQGGVVDGSKPGPLNIAPQDISDADWDYIYLRKPRAETSKIEESKLAQLRREFEYWYPVDMRSSAKDLIKNHLTMSLYNHAAIWEQAGTAMLPRSFFCNGYIMVDGVKMSKHLGNFYTLREILELFGADSTRLALASAGDLLEDANVEIPAIDQSILKLFTLQDWIQKTLAALPSGPLPAESKDSYDLFDRIFMNDMIRLVEETRTAYANMRFRDVVKYAFFEFQNLKDDYLINKKLGKSYWRPLLQYIELQLLLIAPIVPHVADYCWRFLYFPKMQEIGEAAGKPANIVLARFPVCTEKHDPVLGKISTYLRHVKRAMRLGLDKAISGLRGKKKPQAPKEPAPAPEGKEQAKSEEKKDEKPAQEKKAKQGKQKKSEQKKADDKKEAEAKAPEAVAKGEDEKAAEAKKEEKKEEKKTKAKGKGKQKKPEQKKTEEQPAGECKPTEEKKVKEKKPKEKKAGEGKEEEKAGVKFGKCVLFVAKEHTPVQKKVLELLNKIELNENNELKSDLVSVLRPEFEPTKLKAAISFGAFCAERAKEVGKEAFEIILPFDEKALLSGNLPYLALDIPVQAVEVFEITESCPYDQFKESKKKASPGQPEIYFLP